MFKFILYLALFFTVLGVMTEGREINRRDTDNMVAVNDVLDKEEEVNVMDNITSSGQEASQSIAGADLKSIANVKGKVTKIAKSIQKRSLESEQDPELSSCCG
ncbi:uncharacterized protein LOC131675712 [Phymastichus coffea]|uniref:uncharacterized protein LOC131675712 n=1 Tax=Phymastichus coffea TaxID=108790 RepID=UPI00273ADA6E|nr:uncharacterized protein LOC131675712 [Phymastichus coffea]